MQINKRVNVTRRSTLSYEGQKKKKKCKNTILSVKRKKKKKQVLLINLDRYSFRVNMIFKWLSINM